MPPLWCSFGWVLIYMKQPDYLTSGTLARLIPTNSQVELRNTSVTGAILMAVEEFADSLLGSVGAPTGKRAKVHVWLEPVFKAKKKSDVNNRPDALIVVDNGRRKWRALVEAKAKNNSLETEQVERYLDLAKENDIDAVITISNQFVATPAQSPCTISKVKLKKVPLFHWSWMFLKIEAKIQLAKSAVSDPDQAYMLDEYVRFLEDDSSGVTEFDQMGQDWVDTCKVYFSKSKLDKRSPAAASVVGDWDELMRCTALAMSRDLDTNVTTILSPKERRDPMARLEALRLAFIETGILESRLSIPDAASPVMIEADLTRRSVIVSMEVDAPRDRKRATATVTWLLRQLAKSESTSTLVVAKWPGRTPDTFAELGKLREEVGLLLENRSGQMPRAFEVRAVSDLAGKFMQKRNFVPAVADCVDGFYRTVGQYLVPWQAPPPKPRSVKNEVCDQSDDSVEE